MGQSYLFNDSRLGDVLQQQRSKALDAAGGLPAFRALGVSVDELVAELISQYGLDRLDLDYDLVVAESREVKIDVSQDWDRVISDRSQPFYLTGTEIVYFIPFTGAAGLFKLQPSTTTYNAPTGRIAGNQVELAIQGVDLSAEAVKSRMDGALDALRNWVGWVNVDVDVFNEQLTRDLRAAVEARIAKVRSDRDLVSALGVPIRLRDDAPNTYVAPSIRRKPDIRPTRHSGSRAIAPEPVMAMEEYEHILDVIRNMVDVMERSPSAFAHMEEEHLRDQFLVQLNGQYEGGATGETFNFTGKSDILVLVDAKRVFVAECKFWDGPTKFTETVDQLLGYASWRDTKIAILVFNRGRKLSTVLGKIAPTVRNHPNFVQEHPFGSETDFRFVLSHLDDPDRHLTLTVMVFELPT